MTSPEALESTIEGKDNPCYVEKKAKKERRAPIGKTKLWTRLPDEF